jgi:DegV family protein with EDD domain
VSLVVDRKVYRDQVDMTSAEFYRIYRGLKEMPTTVAVSPKDFADIFSELGKTTDNIVCIVVSKALSSTITSAEQARELVLAEHPNLHIELIDSKTSVGALGFVVLEAARAAQAGKSLNEVVQVAHDMIPRVKLIAMLESLKYLIKGGRAPRIALLGELMGVKPIIGLVNNTGKVDPLCKPRTKRKALQTMVGMLKDYADTSKPLHVMVHYAESLEDGKMLREMVISTYHCAEVYMTELTPVMSCHTGPMMALSFYA